MSSVLILEKSLRASNYKHPFLHELISQVRLADTFGKYIDWTDELLLKQLIVSLDKEHSHKNISFDPPNQLLTSAFYQAIGNNIERKTEHATETYIHIINKEFSSAVIFCGGVLVLNSLILEYRSLKFLSLQDLVEAAENLIHEAVIKASHYLDF